MNSAEKAVSLLPALALLYRSRSNLTGKQAMALTHNKFARHVQRLLRSCDRWPHSLEQAREFLDYEKTFSDPEWWATIAECLTALANGNPTLLRSQIDNLPYMLADPAVQNILHLLWAWKALDTPEGEAARKTIAALFSNLDKIPGRRESTKSAKQADTRRRGKDYREKDEEAKTMLRQKLTQAREQLNLKRGLRSEQRQAALSNTCGRILADALNSHNPHVKTAAGKLKKEYKF